MLVMGLSHPAPFLGMMMNVARSRHIFFLSCILLHDLLSFNLNLAVTQFRHF
jgi:hypothetical protein